MPNRILKESIWSSPNLNSLSARAEVCFYRLLVYADDFGRFDARLPIIRGRCYPLRTSVTDRDIEGWLAELVECELLTMYDVGGIHYGQFPTWENHQRIRNKRSRIPAPNGCDDINPYDLARYVSAEARATTLDRDGHKCLACGSIGNMSNPLSIDHIVPISDGGDSSAENLQTLCLLCNLKKYTQTIDYRPAASRGESPQVAADCGRLRSRARNPNPNPNSTKQVRVTPPEMTVYGEFNNVNLTDEQYQKLVDRFGATGTTERIEKLSEGIASKGYKYKSHYATILSWARKDGQTEKKPTRTLDDLA